jgi:hypothetical protein
MEYQKSLSFGTLSVVPHGTIEYESNLNEDSLATQQETIERALFLYFVENNDLIEEVENEEDIEDDNFEVDFFNCNSIVCKTIYLFYMFQFDFSTISFIKV